MAFWTEIISSTVMKHTEAKKNTILNQYLREARKEGFYCYGELKIAKGNTFNLKNIEINQDEGLPALENNGLVWKFSDEDSRKKMCDFQSTPPLPAYLVIKFSKKFYFIRYNYITMIKENGGKSIDEKTAYTMADRVVHM